MVQQQIKNFVRKLPVPLQATLKVRAFSWRKIPLIAFLNPSVVAVGAEKLVLKIPLNFRTKNHLDSMYFGSLAVGAEMCVGLLAMELIENSGHKMPIVFKDFKIDFLKRPEADVHFVCEEGALIQQFLSDVVESEDRLNKSFSGYAYCPDLSEDPVSRFELTLSLKKN